MHFTLPWRPLLPACHRLNREQHRKQPKWNMIEIIPTVEHNRHEDVVLESGAGSVLTTSSQQAYHKHPVAFVSHQVTVRMSGFLLGRIVTKVESSEQVREGEV